ncbi:gamma-glutamyl-gamma-aminobutyrate hydrolase family protein [Piscinibacter sp.]|uniref:gamma-glutamyl-gamma-aminobutyrate hydrolase family protein n=1 Tax=Piscinibacter sp. TaxID=1903157 RepID=UPI002C24A3F2|nr:type 1 glutamine amidotransferase [Albitalea sp.]HUG21822.1 type 1 glutamine amidotransferase [Albitalea sp.]
MSPPRAPLRIGLSARLMHLPPLELGFRNKTLQYLEQSIAHWIMGRGAVVYMLPALAFGAEIERRQVSVRNYVDTLDGLVLQGGADVSPTSYGQQPLRPEWSGDIVRDRYEMELLEGFLAQGKPVLGICRGSQLINVAFGGTLLQDIGTLHTGAARHVDADMYDQLLHEIRFEPEARMAELYPGLQGGRVNSIHHQAVDRLGADLRVEARSADDGVIEAIRARGSAFVAGVQWHPEFHSANAELLSGEPLLDAFLSAGEMARGGG